MYKYYLDTVATTPINPKVLMAMDSYLKEEYANPSAAYSFADNSFKAIEEAREKIANMIHCNPEEIYFTSGGTESNNWALRGVAEANKDRGKHIIVSNIEHHSVLNVAKYAEQNGFEVTYLTGDKYGRVDAKDLHEAVREDTILVSVMTANNEIGTINNVSGLALVAKAKNKDVIFHTDAVSAFGHIDVVANPNIDLISVSGHKFGAPKGVGFLYIKNGTKINPLLIGGSQENGMRGGTYNTAGIVGLGKAVEIARESLVVWKEDEVHHYIKNAFADELISNFNVRLNSGIGLMALSLPHLISCTFLDLSVDASVFVGYLDSKGLICSTGSACNSGSLEPSHVLKAIGLSDEEANKTIRFSFDHLGVNEIDKIIKILKDGIEYFK